MVVVKIEIWPHGEQKNARDLGSIIICNDGTGSKDLGSYNIAVSHGGRYWGKPGVWKSGRLKNYRRSLSPYHLIAKALAVCGIR